MLISIDRWTDRAETMETHPKSHNMVPLRCDVRVTRTGPKKPFDGTYIYKCYTNKLSNLPLTAVYDSFDGRVLPYDGCRGCVFYHFTKTRYLRYYEITVDSCMKQRRLANVCQPGFSGLVLVVLHDASPAHRRVGRNTPKYKTQHQALLTGCNRVR